MEFREIKDALGKWVLVRFANWPADLKNLFAGLANVEGSWSQFKLQGVDSIGIWLEDSSFKVSLSIDSKSKISQEQEDAFIGEAIVLVKWEYVSTIIYLGGQKAENIPLGFSSLSGGS